MRRFVVMLTLLVPSIALAKQPADRKVFPAELTADEAPPPSEVQRHVPMRLEVAERQIPIAIDMPVLSRFGARLELRMPDISMLRILPASPPSER